MKTSLQFRRAFLGLLPAVLILASCSKKDDPVNPVVSQGRIVFSHSAAATSTAVDVFVNDKSAGALNYGQTGSYFNIDAGMSALTIKNGTQIAASQSLNVVKDQSYSAFIYSPTANIGSTGLLVVPDDLTAPATGTAKVRIVHLAVNAPSPVRLSVPPATPGGTPTDLTPDVAFGSASGFVALNAAAINLSVTTGIGTTARTQVIAVGDGTGGSAGTKTFEAGKIYTIVVRGIGGTGVPAAQQPQAVIIQNN